jgi:hypothetical protein
MPKSSLKTANALEANALSQPGYNSPAQLGFGVGRNPPEKGGDV